MNCSRCGAPVKGFQFHCERCKRTPKTKRTRINDENDVLVRGPEAVLTELESDKKTAKHKIFIHAAVILSGSVVSIASYYLASLRGGWYIVFDGAIVYGFCRFLDNTIRYLNLSHRIHKLKIKYDV